MRKNINIINSFRCTNITNFRDLRKNLPKKNDVDFELAKILGFSSRFLQKYSRFLEFFTIFQTSKM